MQPFQRAVWGGIELFLFGFLGFADGLSQACSESSALTRRVPPLLLDQGTGKVPHGLMPQCPAHKLAQLLKENSNRATQLP